MKAETAAQTMPELVKTANRVPIWVLPIVKIAIFASDAVLAFICFAAAFRWRESEPIFSGSGWQFSNDFAPYAAVLMLAIPIKLAMLLYQRVYRLQGAFSYTREAIKIFKAVTVGSLLTIAVAFLFRGGFAYRDFSYSRGVFLLDFALALIAFTAFHLVLRRIQTVFRQNDINLIPTLILGGGIEAEQTINELQSRPDLGYRVVGIIATEDFITETQSRSEKQSGKGSLSVIGNISDLPLVVKQLEIQEVIITDNNLSHEVLFEAMMKIGRKQRVEFRLAPSIFNLLPQKTEVEQIGVLPIIRLFREPLSDAERFIKRASDIAISLVALIVLAPVLTLISILIRLDSKGAALFRQERVGMDGRIFLCFKFRTMLSDADETIHREAYRKNIAGEIHSTAEPVFGKVRNDPRITRVGRWLRRSSLDELPQVLNVLLGDMSIVGARPPIPYEVEEYELWHRRRLDMKPGITGLWQVSGRNRLTFEEMVKLDLYYIENWSLWLDLKIILLTLPAVLRGDGAR
jgi:exopolysaccharide biosynthesis polyprenyl glycosylphosphotransferase